MTHISVINGALQQHAANFKQLGQQGDDLFLSRLVQPDFTAQYKRRLEVAKFEVEAAELARKIAQIEAESERLLRAQRDLLAQPNKGILGAALNVVSGLFLPHPGSPFVKDLQALRDEEIAAGEPLSQRPFSKAKNLLQYLGAVLGERLSAPHLSPDGSGGIRMEWFRDDRNVRIVIPNAQESYVYQKKGGDSEIHPFSEALALRVLRDLIAQP